MKRILIVEDDRDMVIILKNILSKANYIVNTCNNGQEALTILSKFNPHIIVTDINLPGLNGIELLKKVKISKPEIIIIMITAYGNIKDSVSAMKIGAYDYIIKPFNNEELLLIIKKAFENIDLKKEVKYLRKELEGKRSVFIGESAQAQNLLKLVRMIAATDVTVILQGRSGTGKEILASMIHKLSNRKKGPFIAVDCGAIPDTLVESEFFGHEKGSFTGANAQKIGKFEQADGGTLFLDEISNLPLSMQAVLLRVLQERKLVRIGGNKQIEFNIRVVVASNISLQNLVETSEFREDLFYRLNQFMISIPSLTEREEDIPLLANFFITRFANEFNKPNPTLSENAVKKMLDYHWPGNIRELENVIRKAVLLSSSATIDQDGIIIDGNNKKKPHQKFTNLNLEQNRKNLEKQLIEQALQETKGNKIETANILGISRKSLYLKIKDFGIEI